MRVRYTLTTKEWREGRRLSREKQKKSSVSLWVWACIVMPLLGSIGDILHSIRQSKDAMYRGSLLPVLLLLASLTVAAMVAVRWRNERALEARASTPAEDVEMEVGEDGVRFSHFSFEGNRATKIIDRPWKSFERIRVGEQVLVLIHGEGNGHDTIPQRAFTEEQLQRMRRLCARKLRPAREVWEA